ncbi:MAG: uroporphyrinogen-III synthase [Chloroflexi bacterium]|nr:uroporphyrinogen-III synthase [Chloroflexota bacterium]
MIGALAGKRVVNTRAQHQAAALDRLLEARGAIPLPYPCIAIVPPEDSRVLDAALRDAATGGCDWLILTSTNTVLVLSHRLEALGLSLQNVTGLSVVAVGPSTASLVQTLLGLEAQDVPDEYMAEALADRLQLAGGTRVLLPQSAIARSMLADALAAKGAVVQTVEAYQTVCGSGGADIPHLAADGQVDIIIFTSSSTVNYFLERFDGEGGNRNDLTGICMACIGPQTERTALDNGLAVSVMPASHTLSGLVTELETFYEKHGVS